MSNDIAGTLTIAAVPIGCLDDASPRLGAALGQAQIIAAEDTRRLLRLASRLGVPLTARIVSYWDVVINRHRIGAGPQAVRVRGVFLALRRPAGLNGSP